MGRELTNRPHKNRAPSYLSDSWVVNDAFRFTHKVTQFVLLRRVTNPVVPKGNRVKPKLKGGGG
jgi:hypothetical protein